MQSALEFDLRHFPSPLRKKFLKPIGYLIQAGQTAKLIAKEKPDVVWYQAPPTFLAHLLAIQKKVTGYPKVIVADYHNAALRSPWSRIPGTAGFLNKFGAVVVHNDEIVEAALGCGIRRERIVVLEDRTPEIPAIREPQADSCRPSFLFPCSFHSDEPVTEVLEAAAKVPEADFLITGRLSKSVMKAYVSQAPVNVRFTGFLSIEDYNQLLVNCTAVLALTTKEGIQLSAAVEAVAACRPVVLSNTSILRKLFGPASVLTNNTADSLAKACREAIEQQKSLEVRSTELRNSRRLEWEMQAEALKSRLSKEVEGGE